MHLTRIERRESLVLERVPSRGLAELGEAFPDIRIMEGPGVTAVDLAQVGPAPTEHCRRRPLDGGPQPRPSSLRDGEAEVGAVPLAQRGGDERRRSHAHQRGQHVCLHARQEGGVGSHLPPPQAEANGGSGAGCVVEVLLVIRIGRGDLRQPGSRAHTQDVRDADLSRVAFVHPSAPRYEIRQHGPVLIRVLSELREQHDRLQDVAPSSALVQSGMGQFVQADHGVAARLRRQIRDGPDRLVEATGRGRARESQNV